MVSPLSDLTAKTFSFSFSFPDSKTKEVIFSVEDGSVKMFLRGRPVPMLIPDELAPTYSLDTRSELPSRRLKLDWVYGYRGRDCRANLYLLPTGEIVYFVASVAVLYSVEEQRQRHYLGHNDDIKCLAIHPDMVTIATGQVAGTTKEGKPLPPHVRIWDSVSLSTLHVLGLGVFDRAVCCVGFSKSNGGNLLCAVDESNDHMLSVWDWAKETKVVDVKCSNEAVLVATFHPTDPTVLITCGKSHIYFWTLEGGSLSKRQGLFEVSAGGLGDRLALRDGQGGGNRITQAVLGAHDGGVFGLCALRDGTLVSGGGRDRRVVLWGSDYSKLQEVEVPEDFGPVRTVAEGHGDTLYVGTTRNSILQGSIHTGFSLLVQGHVEELWGLAAHPSRAQFVTCGQDKLVHLWSSETHQPLWSRIIEDPARSAGFHPSGSVLAVGTVTGRWLLLDTETHDLVAIHTDGNEQISVVSFSPDGAYLAVGSHDNLVYVYTVDQGGRKVSRLGKCSGHSSFITHLDWAQDSSCFVTNSGDYEILYWDPATCKQITSADAVRNMEWATATCVLGFGVFGIWCEGADGTDINAVARSHDGKLLASADDFGKVHLFSYPCCQPRVSPLGRWGDRVSNAAEAALSPGLLVLSRPLVARLGPAWKNAPRKIYWKNAGDSPYDPPPPAPTGSLSAFLPLLGALGDCPVQTLPAGPVERGQGIHFLGPSPHPALTVAVVPSSEPQLLWELQLSLEMSNKLPPCPFCPRLVMAWCPLRLIPWCCPILVASSTLPVP
uniref:EMAP like 2 n=1 Tax=Saimiri boliviensis boliviensis TaxID=39432 RepID=A0A2K6SX89_SAIBB